LTAGAATGSSTSYEDGTGFDVLASGASFSTRSPQTPRDNNADDEEANEEEPPLDDAAIITTLGGRANDEHRTLRTQCLWMNFFFTILAVVKLKR
jgi:hypothetical protein